MPSRHLLFETDDAGIALVTVNRPPQASLFSHSRLGGGLRFEAATAAVCAATGDYRDGTRAFLEKRRPVFTGK